MPVTGLYRVLVVNDLAASRAFYERHFSLRVVFAADWYLQLASPDHRALQLGLARADHPSVPDGDHRANRATILTIEVDDVDATFARLRDSGVETAGTPRDEPWGQRHFFAIDPAGFLIDVVAPIEPAAEYRGSYSSAS